MRVERLLSGVRRDRRLVWELHELYGGMHSDTGSARKASVVGAEPEVRRPDTGDASGPREAVTFLRAFLRYP